jgi:hypothetical protein
MGRTWHRPRLRGGVAFAGVTLLVVVLGLGLAASRAPGAARGSSPVTFPRPGEVLGAGPVWIRVRAGDRDGDLTASLNGQSVGRQFSYSSGGVRSLQVSPSFGLSYGDNVLRVTVRDVGGRPRSAIVSFTVSGSAPLAAAGTDVTVATGVREVLGGTRSLLPPAQASASPVAGLGRVRPFARSASAPRYSWSLVDAPPDSRFAGRRPKAGLGVTTSPTLGFTPDVPGAYTLRLTVGDGLESGSDTVTVDALNSEPLVPVDTMVKHGQDWGIQVGDSWYSAGSGYSTRLGQLQVLVLKRRTLELVSNTTYRCSNNPFAHVCPEPIEQPDLSKLDSSDLVIAVSQPSFTWSPVFDKGELRLASIGYKPVDYAANSGSGIVSVIGVPQTPNPPPGSAVQRVVSRTPPFHPDPPFAPSAELKGYLTRDNYNNYEFVSADHPSFDLRAAGSSATQNVIELGAVDGQAAQRFVQTLPGGAPGGFQVVIADSDTLKGEQFFFSPYQLNELATKLTEANNQGHELVFVATLGDLGLTSEYSGGVLAAVESAIGTVGGSAQVFGRVFNTPNAKYGLVGASNLGPGQGQEASAAIAPGLADGRLAGTLTRGNDQEFELETEDPLSQRALQQVLFAAPSRWPEQADPDQEQGRREAAAIAWIGDQPTVNLGTNPRSAYWIQPYGPDGGAYWLTKSNAIGALEYQKTDAFTEADLKWAKHELQTEVAWLIQERYYLTNLSQPYVQSMLKTWSDLTSVADKVKAKVDVNGNDKSSMIAATVMGGVLELGEAIPVIGHLFGVESALYRTGLEIAKINQEGVSADDGFQDTVDKLGGQLADRLQAAHDSFDNLAQIIAGDYDKLKTVGTLGNCVPASKDCPRDWQFTAADQRDVTAGLKGALELSFYGALLPARYQVWTLPPSPSTDASKYTCYRRVEYGDPTDPKVIIYSDTPFRNSPATGQVSNPLPEYDGQGRQQYQVWALGYRRPEKSADPSMATPDASITDRIFGAPDPGGDLSKGGLGAFAPLFLLHQNGAAFKFNAWTSDYPPLRPQDCGWP